MVAGKRECMTNHDFAAVAAVVLDGLGGRENVKSLDNCITRLRLVVEDEWKVDVDKIISSGVAGVIRPSGVAVQIVIGSQVQFVADELRKLL